jgi:hypothetical protein
MPVEYSTDLVFRSQAVLTPLYEQQARQAVLSVKAEHVATFPGYKITPQLAQEVGSRFATRTEAPALSTASANRRSNIAGIRRAHLLPVLDKLSAAAVSRQLTRFRTLGLIKRIGGTYRYYLTRIGRSAVAACCRLTEHTIIPALAWTKSAHKSSQLRFSGTNSPPHAGEG